MISFRPLTAADLPLLHEWLGRPHVSAWWGDAPSLAEVEADYAPFLAADSKTLGFIAWLDERPLGFIQSYVVAGWGDGWWEDETDPGARGIDQFLAHSEDLGRGLGTQLVRTFVDHLFEDEAVTVVQTDPSPDNERAIRCYERAGFVRMREMTTPDGPCIFMLRRRSAPA